VKILDAILARLRTAWATEPAAIVALLVSVIVFVCARAGWVVDKQSVSDALFFILPILLGGAVTRSQVSPAARLDASRNADPTDHKGADQ